MAEPRLRADTLAALEGMPDLQHDEYLEYILAKREQRSVDAVSWRAQYRVHPEQKDWVDCAADDETGARSWVDAWERGGVVTEARVIRRVDEIVEQRKFAAFSTYPENVR